VAGGVSNKVVLEAAAAGLHQPVVVRGVVPRRRPVEEEEEEEGARGTNEGVLLWAVTVP
jgi:hypothetical protein